MTQSHYAGSVAVVTGAAAGLGRALALHLASAGAHVALWDVDADGLATTRSSCVGPGTVTTQQVDVTDVQAVAGARDGVVASHGRVDAVFAVAGVIHTGSVLDSDVEDLHRVVRTNVSGTINTVAALLPFVMQSSCGHVVTTSSGFGLLGVPDYSAYCASKFAVRGFTAALRQELAEDGRPVTASCVVPGGIKTSIMRNGTFARGVDAAAVVEGFDRRIARTTVDEAAIEILRQVPRGRPEIYVGSGARLLALVTRLSGNSYQRVVPKLLRRQRSGALHRRQSVEEAR